MTALRNPSPRPELLVDPQDRAVADSFRFRVGFPGPLGRRRIVSCLPTGDGDTPRILPRRLAIVSQGSFLADPVMSLVGKATPRWVPRMLSASVVTDTRRL